MKKITSIAVTCSLLLLSTMGCKKLDETVYGSKSIDNGGAASAADLNGVYSQLFGQSDQANTYALQEHPTDEMMGPTRGTDWGDFGTWRKLHTHTWTPSHNQVNDTWDQLNIGVFRATQVISRATTDQIKAEASFLRAYFMFQIVDLYGQAPFRDPNASNSSIPKVYSRSEATAFIIADLEFAESKLGASANIGIASKAAAEALLAKVYLNKAVYTATTVGGPFTFAKADMDKVIEYANKVTAAGYSLEPAGKYFQDFAWDNTTQSHENIFGIYNTVDKVQGSAKNRWKMGLHYNQTPDGWNGFTTLADFYKSFEATDERRGVDYPGLTDKVGLRAGFAVGQQYGPKGVALKQRGGKPLVFTPDVNLNYSTEAQGIRVFKYFPHPNADGTVTDSGEDNDYVILRYADVMLEKAEAIMRGGTDPSGQTALAIVNAIRVPRGATPLASVDAAAMLAERGRELYYEGWRRNDLIRFEKFNDPVDQRPLKTDKSKTLYPIPQRAVDTNPNLKQNPGY
ncbi:RagB/SusD family nutrient uptake outer membrane protein [Mucilaginibacter sp. AW1-7]|uniref:RagB/SusD family nutrient uptake outer membrane protein n=1 Tax=unclassified Mucilaginibacter TaxID=2617802 RepID=UPI0008D473BE|nr:MULTISPECIES: RagB/SusD family nutrient uptake outer membrane protein [unclassified Mucilaginibacter]WDF79603.1 RagB/SusD family nutrient uptake outer membrane protein [Mucilaginibacter sp. KACC 22773]SEP19789.1 Starch-binding associating with outer membrane [Mucilaginibacter sp. OK283]